MVGMIGWDGDRAWGPAVHCSL